MTFSSSIEAFGPLLTIPSSKDIQIGDIIVARYTSSRWAGPDRAFWEDWHHAALISSVAPLKIIEAVGENSIGQPEGPCEVLFDESAGFGKKEQSKIVQMQWLRPVFPMPIREMAKRNVIWGDRAILAEQEARKRVVEYARKQIGESYGTMVTKWSEKEWYCSLLVYKAYSRTITGMLLETFPAGPYVTPEDLVESSRTEMFYSWTKRDTAIMA